MQHAACPTTIVNAPVEIVWALLTQPEQWGNFYDVRIKAVHPPGLAAISQVIFAESGPRLLRLRLRFVFTRVDAQSYALGIDGRLPFGVTVRENLHCTALSPTQCRVTYGCDFALPADWRGWALHFFGRRGFQTGPVDSLNRLQREAERISELRLGE